MDAEVAILETAQRRSAGLAGGQRRVERAEIGAEDLGRAQHVVEIAPTTSSRPVHSRSRPLPQRIVLSSSSSTTPSGMPCRMRSFCKKPADVDDFGEVVGVGIDADVVAAGQIGQAAGGRGNLDDFEIAA